MISPHTSSMSSLRNIVAMLEKNGILKIANVRDCGLRVIRCGRVVFATSPQERYFDFQFQLSSSEAGQTYLDAVVETCSLSNGEQGGADGSGYNYHGIQWAF